MNKLRTKGFTLIELLVVIAIIGILASVVLTSLNSARNRANDASGQASLSSMRSAAEIYYGNKGNSYAGLCNPRTEPRKLYDAAAAAANGDAHCHASPGHAWAAAIKLYAEGNNGGSQYYCADSTGFAGVVSAPPTDNETVCGRN